MRDHADIFIEISAAAGGELYAGHVPQAERRSSDNLAERTRGFPVIEGGETVHLQQHNGGDSETNRDAL
jgi:hypothetical protein